MNPDSLQAICAELRDIPNEFDAQKEWENALADRLERLDAEMRKEVEIRLFDGQWVNIVNAPGQTIEGAVKATEEKMRENITRGWPPLRPEYKELRARLAACACTQTEDGECHYRKARRFIGDPRISVGMPAQPTPDPNPSPSSQPYDAEGATVEHDPAKAKAMCTVCGDLVHMDGADEHCAGHGR